MSSEVKRSISNRGDQPNLTQDNQVAANLKQMIAFYNKGDEKATLSYLEHIVAMNQHPPQIEYHLATFYIMTLADYKGDERRQKEIRIFQLLESAYSKGWVEAACNLAVCYVHGMGVGKDMEEAIRLYGVAVEKSDPQAMYNLALCYKDGRGVNKDEKKAADLFLRAANRDHVGAQYWRGVCLFEGLLGVEKDEKKAVTWFGAAAEKDHTYALIMLAKCYAEGKGGIPQNDAEALAYYKKARTLLRKKKNDYHAGEAESVEATIFEPYIMANINYWRQCKQRDEFPFLLDSRITQELELLIAKRDLMSALAKHMLAICYEHGITVAKDLDKAITLCNESIQEGREVAKLTLDSVLKLKSSLPPLESPPSSVASSSSSSSSSPSLFTALSPSSSLALSSSSSSPLVSNNQNAFFVPPHNNNSKKKKKTQREKAKRKKAQNKQKERRKAQQQGMGT